MRHSVLNKRLLLAWIEHSVDTGAPMPTDEQIAERYSLSGIESARTLLADLSDAGKIHIEGVGPDRVIKLGRRKPAPVGVGRVEPPIKAEVTRKPQAPGARAEMIRKAAEKLSAAHSPAPAPAPKPAENIPEIIPARPEPPQLPASFRTAIDPPTLPGKLKVPARVTAACIEDGRPLDEFLAALIDMGLNCWRELQAREYA